MSLKGALCTLGAVDMCGLAWPGLAWPGWLAGWLVDSDMYTCIHTERFMSASAMEAADLAHHMCDRVTSTTALHD